MKTLQTWTLIFVVGVCSVLMEGCGKKDESAYNSTKEVTRTTHRGYKRGLVLGDNGWELKWIKSSALPADWDSTFEVVCLVPANVMADIFPEFSTPHSHIRQKLATFRAGKEGVEAYRVEIDPDKFFTRRSGRMLPVSLPGSKAPPGPHIHCTMILANQGHTIEVPELAGREIAYVPTKTVRAVVEKMLSD